MRHWLQFLFHRYSHEQFSPLAAKRNAALFFRLRPGDLLDSNGQGQLRCLTTPFEKALFRIKNALLLNACKSRVEKATYYTFLTLTIEVYNPFDKGVLKVFLERKIQYLYRLLKKIRAYFGDDFYDSDITYHMNHFIRNSLMQQEIIEWMHIAIERAKIPKVVLDAKEALKKGLHPLLVTSGSSGAYWMRAQDRSIAGLFKPFDEEIFAPNNPIGPALQGAMGLRKLRPGIRVGEAAHREVATYLVDQFFSFGIVPRTYYASFTHAAFFSAHENRLVRQAMKEKYGSFQEYVEGFSPLGKLSFESHKSIALEEFQLLVLLDVIIGNLDRNMGNILVDEGKIAAIDHGMTFPDIHGGYSYWYWEHFEQGKEPLKPALIKILTHFPYQKLAWILKKRCMIQETSLERMRERVMLFKEAVVAGHSPARIMGLMTEEFLNPLIGLDRTLPEQARLITCRYLEQVSYRPD